MEPKSVWKRPGSPEPDGPFAFLRLPAPQVILAYFMVVGSMGFMVEVLKDMLHFQPKGLLEPFTFMVLGTTLFCAMVMRAFGFRVRHAVMVSAGAMLVALANWPWLQLGFSNRLWLGFTVLGLVISLPLYGRVMKRMDERRY